MDRPEEAGDNEIGANGMLRHRIALVVEHQMNPLHVYCRLAPLVGTKPAHFVVRRYEAIWRKLRIVVK